MISFRVLFTEFLYICIYFFSFFFPSYQDIITYKTSNFFCGQRIYADANMVSSEEINFLCEKMTDDDRYVVLLSNNIYFSDEKSYSLNSESFFNQQCLNDRNDCSECFGLSIYLRGGKIIITSGNYVKSLILQSERFQIINNIIPYLKERKFYQGLSIAIKQLSDLLARKGGTRRYSGNKSHISFGFGFFPSLFVIICFAICLLACYALYKKFKKEQEYRSEGEKENLNQLIQQTQNPDDYNKALKIHNHLIALENLIKEIKGNSPPMKSVDLCLICMRQMLKNSGAMETTSTRFGCQHVYHSVCLNEFHIDHCLMCEDERNHITIPNNYDTQVLYEEQVKNFIKNLHLIYPNKELTVYAQTYPQEYNSYNDGLMMGLLASSWCMPPVIIPVSYMPPVYYNNGLNEQGNYIEQNNNINSESVVGNFEMQNLGNESGNFGGVGDSGDFCGSCGDCGDFGGDF